MYELTVSNGSLLPTGLATECDWLAALAYRIVARPRGRAWRYTAPTFLVNLLACVDATDTISGAQPS